MRYFRWRSIRPNRQPFRRKLSLYVRGYIANCISGWGWRPGVNAFREGSWGSADIAVARLGRNDAPRLETIDSITAIQGRFGEPPKEIAPMRLIVVTPLGVRNQSPVADASAAVRRATDVVSIRNPAIFRDTSCTA